MIDNPLEQQTLEENILQLNVRLEELKTDQDRDNSENKQINSYIDDLNTNIKGNKCVKEFKIKSFGEHVIRKALNKRPFFKFNNLQKHFQELNY